LLEDLAPGKISLQCNFRGLSQLADPNRWGNWTKQLFPHRGNREDDFVFLLLKSCFKRLFKREMVCRVLLSLRNWRCQELW